MAVPQPCPLLCIFAQAWGTDCSLPEDATACCSRSQPPSLDFAIIHTVFPVGLLCPSESAPAPARGLWLALEASGAGPGGCCPPPRAGKACGGLDGGGGAAVKELPALKGVMPGRAARLPARLGLTSQRRRPKAPFGRC